MSFADDGVENPEIILRPVLGDRDIKQAKEIIAEYIESLGLDLSFQGTDQELADLKAHYYLSDEGLILLAFIDHQLAGCAGLRPLVSSDYINACELKRLYVRPVFRGLGLGLALTEALIEYAKTVGYETMLLDTLDEQEAARELYQSLHFEEIPPYYYSPLAGSHYLKVELS
ncbi:MAG: GNAT family N-acetyltransferase [Saezia sp.]